MKTDGQLPTNLRGPEFYAAYVVAAATQAALQYGANVSSIFADMQSFLDTMHQENPTWSLAATNESLIALDRAFRDVEPRREIPARHFVYHELPETEEEDVLVSNL